MQYRGVAISNDGVGTTGQQKYIIWEVYHHHAITEVVEVEGVKKYDVGYKGGGCKMGGRVCV